MDPGLVSVILQFLPCTLQKVVYNHQHRHPVFSPHDMWMLSRNSRICELAYRGERERDLRARMEKLSVVTVNQKVGMGGESSSAMPKGYLNTQTDEERLFRNLLELRLHRQRIYGLSGYLVNFWLVPNGMGYNTIKYFGYLVKISDIWSILWEFKPNKRRVSIDLRHAIDKIPNHGTMNHF